MERHFILPVSIAAALHVGVLLGFNRVPAVRPPVEKASYVAIAIPKEIEPPDPVDVPEPSAKTPAAEPLPRSAEMPIARPDAIPINVPLTPAVDALPNSRTTIINPSAFDAAGTGARSLLSLLDLDNPPRVRSQVPPSFPSEARREGRNGEVDVEFVVDEAGRVRDARIVKSSDRIFDEPTLHAVAKWRFEPGRAHGQIVRFRMAVPVIFNLDDTR